jgi:hypothetical protein
MENVLAKQRTKSANVRQHAHAKNLAVAKKVSVSLILMLV